MSFWNGHRWEAQSPPVEDAKTPPESRVKRLGAAALEAALVTALVFGLIAGTAFAGKPSAGGGGGGGGRHGGGGSGTGGGSLAVVLVNSPDTTINWGESVTYTVSTTATQFPYVSTQCKQNGVLVLSTSAGFYPSYAWPNAQVVPLATDRWTGGAANCTARLYSMDGGSQTILQTITFAVAA